MSPDDYPRILDPETLEQVCSSCGRTEKYIAGNVFKHIFGCAFRTRWDCVRHFFGFNKYMDDVTEEEFFRGYSSNVRGNSEE